MAEPPVAGSAALLGAIERQSAEIAGLRTDMQALVQGLTLMVESQAAQGEMLQQLLEAATREPPAENPMEALMAQLIRTLEGLTAATQANGQAVARLGQRLAGAIVRGAGVPSEDEAEET